MPSTTPLLGSAARTPQDAAARLRSERDELLRTTMDKGLVPPDFSFQLTQLSDRYFQTRTAEIQTCLAQEFGAIPTDSFAVLAVGGYGRESLCPHSDLDVLVLFRKTIPGRADRFCRDLFLPLWDLGLDLGHGVRSLEECLDLAGKDQKTFTALLSTRYLAGDLAVMRLFTKAFIERAAHHDLSSLADVFDPTDRSERNSLDSSTQAMGPLPKKLAEFDFDLTAENLLEPNLKTSPGGLRDYHRLLWLAVPRLNDARDRILTSPAGPFSDLDVQRLNRDATFLLQTRTALHLTVGRKADVLYLELQPQVAQLLGFVKDDAGLAVEVFLSCLHRTMERIRAMYLSVLRTLRSLDQPCLPQLLDREQEQGITLAADGLTLIPSRSFSGPTPPGKQVMELFRVMGRTMLPLSWTVREILASSCPNLLGDVGERFATLQDLASILTAPGGRQAGRDMLHTGVLTALIPELGHVQDRIQFDAYHLRPLGAHTMETVGFLSDWRNPDTLQPKLESIHPRADLAAEVWSRLPDPTILVLGALLHDIGKGAPDHAAAGAKKTTAILRRFQVPESVTHEITFLVREHLLLFKTATRKDLHDEQAVAACAERIGDINRLDRLFLLSMADARATGPKAWNEWTAALLRDLYFKIRKLFERGPLSTPQAMEQVEKIREAVTLSLMASDDVPPDLDELLRKIPLRYLLTTPTETINRHVQLVARLNSDLAEERIRIPKGRGGIGLAEVETVSLPEMGCHEVTFAVLDQPGIFPVLCGALALHELNVLAAEMFVWPGRVVLTLFKIAVPPDPLQLEELAFRLRQTVRYAMTGKLFLDFRLEEKRRSLLKTSRLSSSLPTSVRIDNESNDFSTQIEIIADDRPGGLYQITDILERLRVRIIHAKVATQADRIVDTFDVRDHLDQKITDAAHLREIQNALLFALRNN